MNSSPKRSSKTIFVVGVLIVLVIAYATLTGLVRSRYVKAYRIPAGSMEPTVLIGDCVLVDRRAEARNPARGDIIVFEDPVDHKKDFLKRVVAVGGDTVEIRDKELWLNGKKSTEPNVIHNDSKVFPGSRNPRDNFAAVTVPQGAYFVLGDNRDNSYDSRFFGFVKKAMVKGTARIIYWSWDRKNDAVRWSRIGEKLQ
jgi:signal peptidase I